MHKKLNDAPVPMSTSVAGVRAPVVNPPVRHFVNQGRTHDTRGLSQSILRRLMRYGLPGSSVEHANAMSLNAIDYSSESFSGGGTVNGVPFTLNAGQDTIPSGSFGFFLYLNSYPATDTTLVDYNFGTPGYIRVKLNSSGHVILELAAQGSTLQADIAGTAIPLTTTVYLAVADVALHGIGAYHFQGGVYLANGAGIGTALSASSSTTATLPFFGCPAPLISDADPALR